MSTRLFIFVVVTTAVIVSILNLSGLDVKTWYLSHVPEWLRISLMLAGIAYFIYSIAAYFYHLKKRKQ